MITASESSLSSVVSEVPVSEVPVSEVVVVESTTPIVPVEVVVESTAETVVADKPKKANKKKAAKKKPTKAKKAAKKTVKKEKKATTAVEATEPVAETVPVVETAVVVSTETAPVVKVGPGRPHRYTGPVEQAIISLFNEIGTVLQTRNVLIAPNDSELSNKRDKSVIPDPLTISMPCLTSLLKRNEVGRRSPGRPKVASTEVATETAEPITVSVEISETIDVVSTESQPVEVTTENIEVATENVEVPATDTAAA